MFFVMTAQSSKKSKNVPFVSLIVVSPNHSKIKIDDFLSLLFSENPNKDRKLQILEYPLEKMELFLPDCDFEEQDKIKLKWGKDINIRFVNSSTNGFTGVNFNIFNNCKGEFILLIGMDTIPEKWWIYKLITPLIKISSVSMVGGEIVLSPKSSKSVMKNYCSQVGFRSRLKGNKIPGLCTKLDNYLPQSIDSEENRLFSGFENVAIRKDVAREMGPKIVANLIFSGLDISLNILKAGYKLFFEPKAIVFYIPPSGLKNFLSQIGIQSVERVFAIRNHAKRFLVIQVQYFGGISCKLPFPLPGLIYWGDFHFLNLFGILAFFNTFSSINHGNPLRVVLGDDKILCLWFFFVFSCLNIFFRCLRPNLRKIFGNGVGFGINLTGDFCGAA